jgi:hypothetical protein
VLEERADELKAKNTNLRLGRGEAMREECLQFREKGNEETEIYLRDCPDKRQESSGLFPSI